MPEGSASDDDADNDADIISEDEVQTPALALYMQ